MPGRHPRSLAHHLENDLASELNEPWVVHLRSYLAKVICSEGSPGRSELGVIEQVEELRPEFEPNFIIGTELCPFEDGEVK